MEGSRARELLYSVDAAASDARIRARCSIVPRRRGPRCTLGDPTVWTHAGTHRRLRLACAPAIATQAAGGKRRLEDLVRYCARPPLSHDRVTMLDNGQISLELKTPWRDGTTHVVHAPLDFIAKLAALIPRPHRNLVLYHGVLAARSKLRASVVNYEREASNEASDNAALPQSKHQRRLWADLMRRAFGYELLTTLSTASGA